MTENLLTLQLTIEATVKEFFVAKEASNRSSEMYLMQIEDMSCMSYLIFLIQRDTIFCSLSSLHQRNLREMP